MGDEMEEIKGCVFQKNFEKVQEGLLKDVFSKNKDFRGLLDKTLKKAVKTARDTLNHDLYVGLNDEHNGNAWPESVEDWCGILENPTDGQDFKKDCKGIHFVPKNHQIQFSNGGMNFSAQ